jgi:alcohol oxidase
MVYARAPASDFDDWAVDGWESKNLIPLMKKVLEYVVCRVVKLKLLLT